MHRALSCRWLNRALRTSEALPRSGVPLFLCPTVAVSRDLGVAPRRISHSFGQLRSNHTDSIPVQEPVNEIDETAQPQRRLPATCSGCGAFTQTSDSEQLGYYDVTARRVRTWLKPPKHELQDRDVKENEVIQNVLESMDSSQLTALGFDSNTLVVEDQPRDSSSRMHLPFCLLPFSHRTVLTMNSYISSS